MACNILDGVCNGLVDRGFATHVLDWVGRLAMADGLASKNLVGALASVRDRDYPIDMDSSHAPDFRACGGEDDWEYEAKSEISCVVAASALREWIHPDDEIRLRVKGLVLPLRAGGLMGPEIVEAWRECPASERRVRFNPRAYLGRPGGVSWFTLRNRLTEAQRQGNGDLAQRLRDALGLVHQNAGIVLAAAHMPAQFVRSVRFRRPTFVDAGSHRRFKTWPDGERARQIRTWGFTTDLAKVDSDQACIDGCVERVSPSISGALLADQGRFEVELLGAVESATNSSRSADCGFAARLRGALTVERLACKLQELLN